MLDVLLITSTLPPPCAPPRIVARLVALHLTPSITYNVGANPVTIVNKLKSAVQWDTKANFDAEKDKTQFRRYEEACARVKNFYKEQHGELRALSLGLQDGSRRLDCRMVFVVLLVVWSSSPQLQTGPRHMNCRTHSEVHGIVERVHLPNPPFLEKQTVEFNIQARANRRKHVRARMGEYASWFSYFCPSFAVA